MARGGKRRKRVRQHVNPLGFVRPDPLPDWREGLARPDRPVEVDVGFAHGEFLLGRAEQAPEHNLVGLEIRGPWVERVRERARRRGLDNVAVVLCNANADFTELFAPASLRAVYVHFPDPWFKKKHHKRRVFTPAFLEDLASRLEPGGRLGFMTDVAEYAEEVVELVEAHPAFENEHGPRAPAPADPERVLTHREAWHSEQGATVHRYAWRRREGGGAT